MYCIIDIETTGGSSTNERITEIAIIKHDGNKVVDEYSTLINPEKNISYFITQLTGITNEMVANAPCFYEVAKQIVEFTEDCVFVAHNVNFDYNFVKAEFKHLGFTYKRDTLCTVNLSKKLLPGHKSYSLGKLCNDLNIEINGRHRAYGDAKATSILFDILLEKNLGVAFTTVKDAIAQKNLNPDLDFEAIKELPEACGVYYFRNKNGDIIYIGKSINIRSRIFQHLNPSTQKGARMVSDTVYVDYEPTGSELVSLLKESFEIKLHKPIYNRAQRRTMQHSGLFVVTNSDGYDTLKLRAIKKGDNPVTSFDSMAEGKERLSKWIKKFDLCQKLSGLYDSEGPCFHYQIKECKGACCGREFAFSYNMRVDAFLQSLRQDKNNMAIIEKGRNDNELAIVWIENGRYLGYGFWSTDEPVSSVQEMRECVELFPDNREVQQIIKRYINKNKKLRIEEF